MLVCRAGVAEHGGEEQVGEPLGEGLVDEAPRAEGERAPVDSGDELRREEVPEDARTTSLRG
jgi:hypothetical protein